MKIKRFFAADIRQAMRMVKDELGADAVIMSNRPVDGGVEIVAARDFDEQLVHKQLQQQEQEKPVVEKSAAKKIQFPDFHAEKAPTQIFSSARKRGSEEQSPIHKHYDQYLGYAEKIPLASAMQQKQSEVNKPTDKITAYTSEQRSKTWSESMATPPKIAQPADQFMGEIRDEIKELRVLLDSRLSGLINHSWHKESSVRSSLLERLQDVGFSKKLAIKIADRLANLPNIELAMVKAQEMLTKILPIAEDNILAHGGIAALVGPTGVGKTTTIAKLAAQFILKHDSRDVALITTDNYRIGAHEQLSIYGRILGVSVKVANNGEELRRYVDEFSNKRLILIDTVGMSQRDHRLAEQIQTLRHNHLPVRPYLVMSATSHYKTVMEIIDAYQILEPQAAILTKFDEAASKATALSAIIERRLPLAFITDGQQVPEDIHEPEAELLIKHCIASAMSESENNDELNQVGWLVENYA